MSKQDDVMTEKEMEIISNKEQIELKRSGNSDVLRVPSSWKHSYPQLKGLNLVFNAYIARDPTGRFLLIFEKEPQIEVTKK